MAHNTIDYAAAFFPFKTPTYIQGNPTHKSLKKLKTELQANANSVKSDLWGGRPRVLRPCLVCY